LGTEAVGFVEQFRLDKIGIEWPICAHQITDFFSRILAPLGVLGLFGNDVAFMNHSNVETAVLEGQDLLRPVTPYKPAVLPHVDGRKRMLLPRSLRIAERGAIYPDSAVLGMDILPCLACAQIKKKRLVKATDVCFLPE
jgi:hypothetical protein